MKKYTKKQAIDMIIKQEQEFRKKLMAIKQPATRLGVFNMMWQVVALNQSLLAEIQLTLLKRKVSKR